MFRWIVIFVAAVMVPLAMIAWKDIHQNFIEGEAPEIELKNPPVGMGTEALQLTVDLRDRQSGLDEVIVRIEQGGRSITVFKKSYPKQHPADQIVVAVDGKKLGLKEGEARLTILAFDASLWSNKGEASLPLRVDYKRPAIEVFADQHNAVEGGAELVFYRMRDLPDTFSGMKIGAELLPGFPARGFDEDFKPFPDVYCAFFPVPLGFDEATEKMQVFARDAVGNMGMAPLSYHIQKIGTRTSEENLARVVLDSKLDELYAEFRDKEARLTGQLAEKPPAIENDNDRVARFQAVNVGYRDLIDKATKPLYSRPKPEKFWDEKFFHFSGKELHSFGERTVYKIDSLQLGEYIQRGVEFSAPIDAPVVAANRGIVIFADSLGPYGKTVLIDHGFGLTTLYSHLSATSRLEGDRVERGDLIGKVGTTGLVFTPTLGFEVRLHGTPVRPIEWWDGRWIADHVDQKVKSAKKALGIRIVTTLH